MNATDEDEFGDFLGLPSEVGLSSKTHVHSRQTNNSKLSEPDLYNELYGVNTGQDKPQGYDDFFGDTTRQPVLQSATSVVSQSGNELAHEPLFPDVDETKILPTVGLGITQSQPRQPVSTEGEFSIVIDPSGLDSRFTPQNSGPMAGWVLPTGHGRRDTTASVRTAQGSFPSATTTPSVRPPTGAAHHTAPSVGPLHPRAPPGSGSRPLRIPPGCNPDLEPEFPTRAAPDQALKLPGQTRVTPDEYKEFLGLGHGEIFNLDLDRVVDPPWRAPGTDSSDFFNYGMDEAGWKDYCKRIESHRQEFSMKKKIQTYESTSISFQQDPDLPPEVAAAIAAETTHTRSGATSEIHKALPIPVFQGVDDYSMRNRRGRDFRRPEVRYDPEVILELVGGVETSNAVNADYGEDYVGLFGPPEMRETLKKGVEEQEDYTVAEQQQPEIKKENEMLVSDMEDQDTLSKRAVKEEVSAMFEEDELGKQYDTVQPGELAMGMDTELHNPWSVQQKLQPPPPNRVGVPPRGGDFGRNFDFYMPPQEIMRPFHQGPPGGRSWRPRVGQPPEFWNPGRSYGRYHGEGRRGGRPWSHPYAYGRRPARHPIPQRYEEYPTHPEPLPWPRKDDPGLVMEDEKETGGSMKGSGYREYGVEKTYHDREGYRDYRERRRYEKNEWAEEKPPLSLRSSYSGSRSRGQNYPREKTVTSSSHHHHRETGGGRSRKEDYEDRHREKRRREKSTERRPRRASKEKTSRGREKDERRSRRHETSSESGGGGGSEPTSHYRSRSERD